MTCGIYKIENLLNGKCYIGQSINIESRIAKHKSAKDNFYIHRALRYYGVKNFSFMILEECDQKLLDQKEKEYIFIYNSLAPNGYNMIPGGSNGAGLAKGKAINQYTLEGKYIKTYPSAKQASINTGLSHGTICACCRGERNYTGNYQWRYVENIFPLKCYKKIIQFNTKKVIQKIDINNNRVLNEYPSLSAAAKSNRISVGNISECCSGKRKTAGGFKWIKKK